MKEKFILNESDDSLVSKSDFLTESSLVFDTTVIGDENSNHIAIEYRWDKGDTYKVTVGEFDKEGFQVGNLLFDKIYPTKEEAERVYKRQVRKYNKQSEEYLGEAKETYYGGWGYLKWEDWVEDDLEDYNGPVSYDRFFERVHDDGQVEDAAFEIYNSRSTSAQNKIAKQWYKEYKSLFKDCDNNELNEEDLPDVELEEPITISDTKFELEEPSEEVVENAYLGLLNTLISKEWDMINEYKSIIATLELDKQEELIKILNNVVDEKTIQLGMLNKAVELLDDDSVDLMKQGEDKAEEILAETEAPLDESLQLNEGHDIQEYKGFELDWNADNLDVEEGTADFRVDILLNGKEIGNAIGYRRAREWCDEYLKQYQTSQDFVNFAEKNNIITNDEKTKLFSFIKQCEQVGKYIPAFKEFTLDKMLWGLGFGKDQFNLVPFGYDSHDWDDTDLDNWIQNKFDEIGKNEDLINKIFKSKSNYYNFIELYSNINNIWDKLYKFGRELNLD